MRSWLFLIIVSLFIGAPAIASEQGQYRPGHTYLRAPAQHPDMCASQCAGDALCKSWNFVGVNTPYGAVCEFNARLVTPISNPMSISGLNPTAWDSSKIIPAGYRTTRVGHPNIQPQTRRQNTIRVGQVPMQHNAATQRRVVPAPNTRQIRRPNPAPSPSPVQMPAPLPVLNAAPKTPIEVSHRGSQRMEPQLDVIERPAVNPAALTMRQPEFPAQTPHSAASATKQASSGLTPISQMPATPMRRSMTESGLAGAPVPARQSLYGSLHDDVKIPRALTPADIPDDPDAPIPTVRSVPVAQIDQGNL